MQSEAAGQTYAALDSARNFVASKVEKVKEATKEKLGVLDSDSDSSSEEEDI